MNKKTLESAYRRFLPVAEKWNAIVTSNAVFHDKSASGEPFRHVALIHDRSVLEEARRCLAQWQDFADMCKKAEKTDAVINVVESAFLPVPLIIEDKTQTTQIILQSAISTRIFTREEILKKYNTIIKKSKKSPIFAPLIKPLMEELAFFEKEPINEVYRARNDRFTGTIIATTAPDSNTQVRHRVGAHGALVFAHLPDTTLPVTDFSNEKRRSTTVYDGVEPLPCAPLGDASLFRLSDMEQSQKTIATKTYIIRCIEGRNIKFNNRVSEIMAKAKPTTENILMRKIEVAREALNRLEAMDRELVDVMVASGDDLSNMKLRDARHKYGKGIEERYGVTFNRMQSDAKLR